MSCERWSCERWSCERGTQVEEIIMYERWSGRRGDRL